MLNFFKRKEKTVSKIKKRVFFKNLYNNHYVEIEKITQGGYEIDYGHSFIILPDVSICEVVGEVNYDPLFRDLFTDYHETWYPEWDYGFNLFKKITE